MKHKGLSANLTYYRGPQAAPVFTRELPKPRPPVNPMLGALMLLGALFAGYGIVYLFLRMF